MSIDIVRMIAFLVVALDFAVGAVDFSHKRYGKGLLMVCMAVVLVYGLTLSYGIM